LVLVIAALLALARPAPSVRLDTWPPALVRAEGSKTSR